MNKAEESFPLDPLRAWYMCAKSLQLCPTLCDPGDYSLPGFSVHGIFQARILEWMAISFSRGSSQPRDQTRVLCLFALAGGFFTTSATCEPLPGTPVQIQFTAEVSVQMVVNLPKVPGRLHSQLLSCAFKG